MAIKIVSLKVLDKVFGSRLSKRKPSTRKTLAGRRLMALEKAPKGFQPFETLSFSIESPRKNQSWKGGEGILKGTVEVTDLYRGAFLLCMGCRLEQVRVRNNGRAIATFLITGPDLERIDNDYRTGRGLVNPVALRESLNHLRDVMFEKLNEGRKRHGNRTGGYRSGQTY